MVHIQTYSTTDFVDAYFQAFPRGDADLASLDYDHIAYFLNRYGVQAIAPIIDLVQKMIHDRLDTCDEYDQYVSCHSSLDEMYLAYPHDRQESMIQLLVETNERISAHYRSTYPSDDVRFGFTVSIATPPPFPASDPAAVLRVLAARNEEHLSLLKGNGHERGTVVVAPEEYSGPPFPDVSIDTWRRLRGVDDSVLRTALRPERTEFVESHVRPRSVQQPLLLVVQPLFGGSLFSDLAPKIDRAKTTLATGTTVGRLGFLNRIYGEHLTPNLIMERLFAIALAMCPFAARVPASSASRLNSISNLVLRVELPPSDQSTALEALAHWLESTRREINAVLGNEVTVACFRVAVFPNNEPIEERVLHLGRLVFRIPADSVSALGSVEYHSYLSYSSTPVEVFDERITSMHHGMGGHAPTS